MCIRILFFRFKYRLWLGIGITNFAEIPARVAAFVAEIERVKAGG